MKFILALVLCAISLASAALEPDSLAARLHMAGFENVRVAITADECLASIENTTFRWDVLAIATALDIISQHPETPPAIHLVILQTDVPRVVVSADRIAWIRFRENRAGPPPSGSQLQVSHDTRHAWDLLRTVTPANRSRFKTDLVAYPQFSFENTRFDKIYETQLNIAPALETSLWRGMQLTAQVIFPIVNELGYEGDFIRPGLVTVSQQVKLPRQWYARLSAGNFTGNRYGLDLLITHPLGNSNFLADARVGLTGSSHFLDNRFITGRPDQVTASAALSWYYPRYNLEFRGGMARYVYGDAGLFASCTRHFNKTQVGFYLQLGEESRNGGFYCAIPLPVARRNARKALRLTLPRRYNFTYNGGTEFYHGQNFTVQPDEYQYKFFNFTRRLKDRLLSPKTHIK